ncbi:MAG: SWIM zinc finger family protein, partial [Patescibacteria group bacterium]|nr:SWIM zinc finger family protein [Patescibacteria group bacterium]
MDKHNTIISTWIYYTMQDGKCNREEKGKEIAANPSQQIFRINDNHYTVKSQTTKNVYNITMTNAGWVCECGDYRFRHICCKHIHAVEFSIRFRDQVREANKVVIKPINISQCKFCTSQDIIKKGLRKNQNYSLQVYKCRACNKRFSINLGFERMKVSPKVITSAMQLYFTGESLRNVQKFLELQGVIITHKTVWNWIRKYTGLMDKYLENITPQVGDTWRADEVWVKVKGDKKYLFALMDDETRYWIA